MRELHSKKFPLGENQITNRVLVASISHFFVALCNGHRHRLEPLIDVRKFVCYRWVGCTELVGGSTEATHFGPE